MNRSSTVYQVPLSEGDVRRRSYRVPLHYTEPQRDSEQLSQGMNDIAMAGAVGNPNPRSSRNHLVVEQTGLLVSVHRILGSDGLILVNLEYRYRRTRCSRNPTYTQQNPVTKNFERWLSQLRATAYDLIYHLQNE